MSIVFEPGERTYRFDGVTVVVKVDEPGVGSEAVAEMFAALAKANPKAVREALESFQDESSGKEGGGAREG